jgi:hypothetical protein
LSDFISEICLTAEQLGVKKGQDIFLESIDKHVKLHQDKFLEKGEFYKIVDSHLRSIFKLCKEEIHLKHPNRLKLIFLARNCLNYTTEIKNRKEIYKTFLENQKSKLLNASIYFNSL